jgi:hypothetical protein
LEVSLATAIGVVLLGALYVAVDLQLRHAQIAREMVEESTLARAILARIAGDIKQNIGPMRPATATGSGGGQSGAATASTSSGAGASATPATGSSGGSTSTPATATNAIIFNVGVQGDSSHLVLSTARVVRDLPPPGDTSQIASSDLHRIAYWLQGSADSSAGLARAEIDVATSDSANVSPANLPDDASYIIASEVAGMTLRYFDGTDWQDSWDGTTLGPDGQTPIGPPVAIEITLTISGPDTQNKKTYRRVVCIPTANGIAQQSTTTNQ